MKKDARIFVAGHRGMVGSALMRLMNRQGFTNLVTASRQELDLRDRAQVQAFLERERPDCVILAAAKVGGIQANRLYPADFIYDNLMIQSNVIHQACLGRVNTLVFLGSSCIYPRECPQPMKEEYLLTGPLEPTNEGYALAKIAGLKMARYYHQQYGLRCVCPMPCNLYGPNDSFDPEKSHVLSALVRRFVDAVDDQTAEVVLWGSGTARREFLHVDDLARAVLLLVDKWESPEIINVGSGTDHSIRELAEIVARKVRYHGTIRWDTKMPDGMPRKCLDTGKLSSLGFRPSIALEDGIDTVIEEYRARRKARRDQPPMPGDKP